MKKYRHLTYESRKRMEVLYLQGEQARDIAGTLGVHVATVYKELRRGDTGSMDKNGRVGYSAELAQRNAFEVAKSRREKMAERAKR